MAVDIGAEAIDRGDNWAKYYTLVNADNPAGMAGVVASIDIWAAHDMGGLIVGTFYKTNGNTLKCRASVAIAGTITAGSKVNKVVSIAVEIGDYIGCYYTSGTTKNGSGAVVGHWYFNGEATDPNDEEDYVFWAGYAISLGGYIEAAPRLGAATLSGIGTLAGIGRRIFIGQSTLSGIGSLSAIGLILGKIYGSAALSGIGDLSVSSVLNMRATASLTGAGSIVVVERTAQRGLLTLAGIGSMTAAGMRIRTGSVILVGTGLLVIRGRITFLIEPDSLGFSDTEADGIMVAPYYLGNTIPLIFTVSEGGVALSPSSVTIRIVKPDKTVDETSEAIITNDEVECLIPASITDEAGTYQVYFKMNLPNYLIRTHKMTFEVLNNR